MTLTKIPVTSDLEQGKLVRVGLNGGCPLEGCTCSATPYILVSDGETAFAVTLTNEEAANIKAGHPIDLR